METQYISLNMTPTGVNPCFHISQYDVGRMLGFIVHSGGATVDLDTYTCTIEATRSDGTAITSAVATTDNIGTFEVTPTMSNKADKYRCQLIIVDENSKRIASLPFDMEVTKAAMDENSEAIEEDASLYQQYTEAVQGAIAEANADIQAEKNALDELATTVTNNKHVVTFEDYGAKGDGTTDDTQSITNAIQASKGKKLTLTSAGGTYLVNGDINLTSVKLINFGTISCTGTVTIDDSIVILGNFYNANVVANGYGTILSKITINHFNGVGLTIKILTKTAGADYNPSIFSGLLINNYDVETGTVGVSIDCDDVFLERTDVINTLTGYKILKSNVSLTNCGCWINNNIKKAENWESNIAYDVYGTSVNLINCRSDSYYTAINTQKYLSIRLTNFLILCNVTLFNNFTLNITNIDSSFIEGSILLNCTRFNQHNINVKNHFTNCNITSINTNGVIDKPQYREISTASSGSATGYFDYNGLRKRIYVQVYHPNAGENLTINVLVPNRTKHYGWATCYANNQVILLPYTLDNTTLTITGKDIPKNSNVLCTIEFYESIA